MQTSLSREPTYIDVLVQRARYEFNALGFIPTLTASRLMAQGINVDRLERSMAENTW